MLQVVVVAAKIGLQPASIALETLHTCGQEALLVLEPVLMLLRADGDFQGRSNWSTSQQNA